MNKRKLDRNWWPSKLNVAVPVLSTMNNVNSAGDLDFLVRHFEFRFGIDERGDSNLVLELPSLMRGAGKKNIKGLIKSLKKFVDLVSESFEEFDNEVQEIKTDEPMTDSYFWDGQWK